MSTSPENIPNVSFPGGVEPPFKSAPYTLHTSDGKDRDPAVDCTVTFHPDGHRINPEVASLVGHQLGVTTSPYPVVPAFPHLAPTGHEDIPALADLLGLREHTPQQPAN